MPDVVITWLLTAKSDPQRGEHLPADAAVLDKLRESVHHHGRTLTVLHDCLDIDGGIDEFVRVEPGGNPYFYRWRITADWLAANKADLVWCVDGTDVEMLHDPFPEMDPDKVYSGSETSWPLPWLKRHCPSRYQWCRHNNRRPFLNMGILGGHHASVEHAAELLAASEADGDDWEMGAWQQIAAETFGDRIVTGEPVHTEFKAYDRTHPTAWWAHK